MAKLRKIVHYTGLFGDVVDSVECPDKGVVLRPWDLHDIRKMMAANHYSGNYPQNSTIVLGVFHYGNLRGGVMIGYGMNPAVTVGTDGRTREFDRMWLSDDMPKFSESIVLSMLHLYLRRAHPEINRLTSYADMSVGNHGTIYKAANYKLMGKVPCGHYVTVDGERLHAVTLWGRYGTNKLTELQKHLPGIRKINGAREGVYQLKYEYWLQKPGSKQGGDPNARKSGAPVKPPKPDDDLADRQMGFNF